MVDSLDQSVKTQFAKIFVPSDWRLFKDIAEINFSEAAFLKKSSFNVASNMRLLVRNSRKRLLIGIGAEFLVKAIYLKTGYCINKPQDPRATVKLPFTLVDAAECPLKAHDTFTLDQLSGHFKQIIQLTNPRVVMDGLSIARIFRNKEGHVVTRKHKFDPSSYRTIEAALVEIYANAFQKQLKVRFSLEDNEKAAWCVLPSMQSHEA